MKIGRAEIGIILTLFSSAPFFGWWFYVIFSIFPSIGQQTLVVSSFCVITIVGMFLAISDPGGFLCRRKGNGQLAAVLMILGFILLISSLFVIIMEEWYWSYDVIGKFRTPSPEKLTLHDLSISWSTLAFFSSLLWLAYGLMISFIRTSFQPQKKVDFEEPWTKPPENLLARYVKQYPHNPNGVLEWHIHKKMKEGRTREQAIEELQNMEYRPSS